MYCAIKKKNFEFPRWPSELLANQCWPICPAGPLSQHWLAGKSEGPCGISEFNVSSNRFYFFASLENEFSKVSFFYHPKLVSHIMRAFCCYALSGRKQSKIQGQRQPPERTGAWWWWNLKTQIPIFAQNNSFSNRLRAKFRRILHQDRCNAPVAGNLRVQMQLLHPCCRCPWKYCILEKSKVIWCPIYEKEMQWRTRVHKPLVKILQNDQKTKKNKSFWNMLA